MTRKMQRSCCEYFPTGASASRRLILSALLLLFGVPIANGWAQDDLGTIYETFQNPPAEYSMLPLMRINDQVRREEIRWQFEQMKAQGIHGVFLLPEWLGPSYGWKDAGMPYEYLSPEFFEAMRIIAEEAKAVDFNLWLYDELDWPSGNAGGKIPEKPEFRSRVLDPEIHTLRGPRAVELTLKPDAELISVVAYRKKEGRIDTASASNLISKVAGSQLRWQVPAGDWEVAFYYTKLNKGFFYEYDGDVLNPEAMREFIEITHARYREEVEKRVGLKFRGIFTDEPHIASFREYQEGYSPVLRNLPWNRHLSDTFFKLKGYDIRERLPLLYLEGGPETAKVRADFWEVVSRMFEENYFGQIQRFSTPLDWKTTGHLNGEESLWWHLVFDAGTQYALFRQMDYPGFDWILPFNYTHDYGIGWLAPFAAKVASSVAHLYGKPRVLTEVMAGSGWGVNFEQMRRMADWTFVLGANMFAPITYKYSLKGADRTTSYPPGVSYQQPWWSEMKGFADYVSRLSYLLSQGEFQAQVAVVLPVTEVWANFRDREGLENLTRQAHLLTNELLKNGLDFDFVDDESVQNGRLSRNGIGIGKKQYQAMVLLPSRVVSKKTLAQVDGFAREGGVVAVLNRPPTGSIETGDPDPEIESIVQSLFGNRTPSAGGRVRLVSLGDRAESLVTHLKEHLQLSLVLEPHPPGVYFHHRKLSERDVWFVVNTTAEEQKFSVAFTGEPALEVWNPESAERYVLPTSQRSSRAVHSDLSLLPYQSLIVVTNSGLSGAGPMRQWRNPIEQVEIFGDWKFHLEPTLNDPHLAWNFSPLPEGWKLKDSDESKIKSIRAGSWQERGLPFYSGKGVYEKTFQLPAVGPKRRYLLDLGRVGIAAHVWVNGKSAGSRLWQPYTFDITNLVRSGENHLKIAVVNTLANYYSQFEQLRDAPLYRGGTEPWMLPSGLLGPVNVRTHE